MDDELRLSMSRVTRGDSILQRAHVMKFNRLFIWVVPVGLLVPSCNSGSTNKSVVTTTTTISETGKTVNGRWIGPGSNLFGADLSGANLRGANLRGTDLTKANLDSANLDDADLRGVILTGATMPDTSIHD